MLKKLAFVLMTFVLAFPAVAQDFKMGLAAYKRGDYATALQQWQPLANKGDARAQYAIGELYYRGQGVSQDYMKAMEWYLKAAEQGYVKAQTDLGYIYAKGPAFLQDYAEAVKWNRRAADQGDALAQHRLGIHYRLGQGVPKNYSEAINWYRKAAEQGYVKAQYSLALIYAMGEGVPRDLDKALKWTERAAANGYAPAQNRAGLIYLEGHGVRHDYALAAEWFLRAAKQGHAKAQFNLGMMYEEGKGVAQNTSRAAMWYRAAAHQGHMRAAALYTGKLMIRTAAAFVGALTGLVLAYFSVAIGIYLPLSAAIAFLVFLAIYFISCNTVGVPAQFGGFFLGLLSGPLGAYLGWRKLSKAGATEDASLSALFWGRTAAIVLGTHVLFWIYAVHILRDTTWPGPGDLFVPFILLFFAAVVPAIWWTVIGSGTYKRSQGPLILWAFLVALLLVIDFAGIGTR